MKHLLTPLLLLTLLFPSIALPMTDEWTEEYKRKYILGDALPSTDDVTAKSFDDLVKRGGLYYEKFTDTPFTGKATGKKQGRVKTGKRDGLWVSYHENGQLE